MIYILISIKIFLSVTKQWNSKENYRIMAHSEFSISQKLQEEKNAKLEIPVFVKNLHQNAESAEVSDIGMITGNFMIHWF